MRAGKDFGPRPEDPRTDEEVVRDRISRHQRVLVNLNASGAKTPLAQMRRSIALGAIENNLNILNQLGLKNIKNSE